MLHDDIAEALTEHENASPLLKQGSQNDPERKSAFWFVGNYVDLYSKEWTEGHHDTPTDSNAKSPAENGHIESDILEIARE
jgi:hypothetical protein